MNFINQIIPRWISKTIVFFSILFIALLGTHWNLIKQDPLLDYDDQIVVKPMEHVNTLSDYLVKINNGQIYDRQPVRDFSFWIDYQIKNYFSVSIFHLHNLIIWYGILVLFFFILLSEKVSKRMSAFVVALYAFHPALTNAVSWASARKHLLSTFFILSATLIFLTGQRRKEQEYQMSYLSIATITILYFLSCFSQPISILWPIWATGYLLTDEILKKHGQGWSLIRYNHLKRKLILIISIFTIGVAAYVINSHYYEITYVNQADGVTKFLTPEDNNLSLKLMAIGASFFQIVCPIYPTPAPYYPGDTRNMVGLGLIVILGFFLYKTTRKKQRPTMYLWAIFASLPLVVIIAKLTNIIGSDTYIIIPTIGLYIIFAEIVTVNKLTQLVLGITLLFFIYTSYQVSNSWLSKTKLWTYANEHNKSPTILRGLAIEALLEKQYELCFKYSLQLLQWNSSAIRGSDVVYVEAVSYLPNKTAAEKILLLEKGLGLAPDSAAIKYTLAINYAHDKKWKDALKYMRYISAGEFKHFAGSVSGVTAEFYFYCLQTNNMNVEACKIIPENIKTQNLKYWNEKQYKTKLSELLK